MLSWMFFVMEVAASRRRYGFLANMSLHKKLDCIGGEDKTVLPWSQLGNSFHCFIEGEQILISDLVGNYAHQFGFFRDIGSVEMQNRTAKFDELCAIYMRNPNSLTAGRHYCFLVCSQL